MEILEAVGAASGRVRTGTIERIDDAGAPWVKLPRRKAVRCRVLEGLTAARLERARAERTPVLVSLLGKSEGVILGVLAEAPGAVTDVDGETVLVRGKEELTLRCGKASITLTADGKLLLKGAYVLSHSTGTNRVRGGSVQIN